ncbi:MAG: class I SAM-dependent methyltransferase, partial [Verrucomicrobiaceae bacterium]
MKTQVFMISGGFRGEPGGQANTCLPEPNRRNVLFPLRKREHQMHGRRICNPVSAHHPAHMSQPYLSLEAELHDAFWEAEDDGSEVRLMETFLKKFPGPALEIGAGSGRLMFPLLQKGLDVEGLELSRDMLTLGRKRAEGLGIRPVMHEGDMTEWLGSRKFAALLAPAFTLQLAPDPAAALKHWHSLLENRGGLYLTVF